MTSVAPLAYEISNRAMKRGLTAAPALGSLAARLLPDPVTSAPAVCGLSSAGLNPTSPAPIAVMTRDSRLSPPLPVSTLMVPPT
jgi:hypothetical protein